MSSEYQTEQEYPESDPYPELNPFKKRRRQKTQRLVVSLENHVTCTWEEQEIRVLESGTLRSLFKKYGSRKKYYCADHSPHNPSYHANNVSRKVFELDPKRGMSRWIFLPGKITRALARCKFAKQHAQEWAWNPNSLIDAVWMDHKAWIDPETKAVYVEKAARIYEDAVSNLLLEPTQAL